MPRGKELEQLPMANTLPGMGNDNTKYNRDTLNGITDKENPMPSQVGQQNKKQQ